MWYTHIMEYYSATATHNTTIRMNLLNNNEQKKSDILCGTETGGKGAGHNLLKELT